MNAHFSNRRLCPALLEMFRACLADPEGFEKRLELSSMRVSRLQGSESTYSGRAAPCERFLDGLRLRHCDEEVAVAENLSMR
mmetsp:Transcript_3295/g.6196  ORF Transcript_3295/g.6196 Transcript_3295/m.6196 type:complete len:82 (+) Transcript_3295:3-248(+)